MPSQIPIERTMHATPKTHVSRRILLAIIIAIGLGFYIYPAVKPVGSRGRRSPTLINLKRIGLALHYYHSKYDSLPPAYVENEKGEKIHSWRALILPFMGNDKIFHSYKLSEPWYSDHNRSVARKLARKFKGDDRFWSTEEVELDRTETDYVVVIGPRTAFPGTRTVKFEQIENGMSNVIFVLLMKRSGIDWFEPRDLYYEQVDTEQERNIILRATDRPHSPFGLLGDGSVSRLNFSADDEYRKHGFFITNKE